jgi:ABC-type uncharacterized transport system auxiliary subunit
MKARIALLTLALCFVVIAPCFAQAPQLGTWKLNEVKSKNPSGFPKNTNVVYEAVGDKVKVTTDGTGPDGASIHTEWTGKFDGKDYPLTGDPTSDSRSYKLVNDNMLKMENKKGGKAVFSGRIVVSPDGKTRTLTATTHDAAGKKVSGVSAYNKQ